MLKSDDRTTTSENSVFQQGPQDFVTLCVYGIREPGNEIKVEMVQMITKKLNLTTLDLINQSLARNPKCKLTPQDVEVF